MKHKKIWLDGKYQPIRMCIACRQHRPQRELIRVCKTPEGIFIDQNHRLGGRGVYVCRAQACVEKAQLTRGLERGLKSAVPAELYEECRKLDG